MCFYNHDICIFVERCTENVRGRVGLGSCSVESSECDTSDSTNALNDRCKFCHDEYQDVEASSMSSAYIDQVTFAEIQH